MFIKEFLRFCLIRTVRYAVQLSFHGSEKSSMRLFYLAFLLCFSVSAFSRSIRGKVLSPPTCAQEVMVWLALDKNDYPERLLLMHTQVPVGGTFQFFLKPGNYQLRASDEKGCETLQKVSIGTNETNVVLKLEKK
jgi:hypothetical protein